MHDEQTKAEQTENTQKGTFVLSVLCVAFTLKAAFWLCHLERVRGWRVG